MGAFLYYCQMDFYLIIIIALASRSQWFLEDLKELREYLIEFDKRQREKENNIDLPFSQFAWSS